jgi:hypothetical protein
MTPSQRRQVAIREGCMFGRPLGGCRRSDELGLAG